VTSPDRFANQVIAASRQLQGAHRDAVNEAAVIIGKALDAAVVSVVGSDRAFSGTAPRDAAGQRVSPGKIGAQVKKARAPRNSTAIVGVVPAGLASIINSGAKPHVVGARTARGKALRQGIGFEQTKNGLRLVRITASGKFVRSRVAQRPFLGNKQRGYAMTGPIYGVSFRGTHKFDQVFDALAPRVAGIVAREQTKALAKVWKR